MSHAVSHSSPSELLRGANVEFAGRPGAMGLGLMGAGFVLAIAAMFLAKSGLGNATMTQGLHAVHIGIMAVLAPALVALLFLMIFNLLNAGWTATLKRQFENVMTFIPIAYGMALAIILADCFLFKGLLFTFLNPDNHADALLQKKWFYFFGPAKSHGGFVFPTFFLVRALIYGGIWWFFVQRFWGMSHKQDETGDRSLSAKLRFTSAWGTPVLALTIAFAGFDWLMALDFRFFSTMWGVYYFAGGAFSLFATMALIAIVLRGKGKLEGLVTPEHFHDLGKLFFAFTVFWGYIAFSQYFLIWYSNIPEETAYYKFRTEGNWRTVGIFLILAHFAFPFLILLSRHVKKHTTLLAITALVAIGAHLVDIYWNVRPLAYAGLHQGGPGSSPWIVDVLGVLGPVLVFAGYLAWRVPRGRLVAVNDPWMHEALEHRNYV